MKGISRTGIRYSLAIGATTIGVIGFASVSLSQRGRPVDTPLPIPNPSRQPTTREIGAALFSSTRLKLQSTLAAVKAPTPPPAAGFALPYSGSAAAPNAGALDITNTDPGNPVPGGGTSVPVGIMGTGVIGVNGNSGSARGTGVLGICLDGAGVTGNTITGVGIQGGAGANGSGVLGENRTADTHAWLGTPEYAFRGTNGATTDAFIASKTNAIYGRTGVTDGQAILGVADSGTRAVGIFGISANGWAGYFRGKVQVTGTLTAASKQFTIDHPLEPETKTLSHACVESDSLKNIYDGIATLNKAGESVVTLPDWFEALNKDFRYQLTCIGGHAPVFISREIKDRHFTISGGHSGLKVSWQITGVRKDKYALTHPLTVEAKK